MPRGLSCLPGGSNDVEPRHARPRGEPVAAGFSPRRLCRRGSSAGWALARGRHAVRDADRSASPRGEHRAPHAGLCRSGDRGSAAPVTGYPDDRHPELQRRSALLPALRERDLLLLTVVCPVTTEHHPDVHVAAFNHRAMKARSWSSERKGALRPVTTCSPRPETRASSVAAHALSCTTKARSAGSVGTGRVRGCSGLPCCGEADVRIRVTSI